MEAQKKRSAIQPEEIIAHLQVLASFHKLKLDVQSRAPHNPQGLWNAFLGYAVEKFASWISNVVDKEGSDETELVEEEFPTLDVAMVWHAYILNPVEYHNDCQKSQKGLSRIKYVTVMSGEVLPADHPTFHIQSLPDTSISGCDRLPGIGTKISVAAVKRQASFIAQVAAVGWTQKPKSLGSSTTNVFIDRYHSFLKKLWENPNQLVVPTLEIDLAWHTHQLNVETYRKDSMMLFGRILQHDDDIPSPEINKAFKRNSYDWRNLCHMDYSTGSIYSGFRPLSSGTPGTPMGSSRSLSTESSRTGSEISLQEVYRAVSEKRLSDVPSSFYSLSPPSSSGRGSTPSPPTPSTGGTPSGSGHDSPSNRGSVMMMLQPTKNDSTSTISPRPSNHALDNPSIALISDSRASSSSELSSMFAYAPPAGAHERRGAFDRPPSSAVSAPGAVNIQNMNGIIYGSSTRRPASAGNPALRPALKRSRHHTSNSTGALYIPEMPSPLSQLPKGTIDDQSQVSQAVTPASPYPPYKSSSNIGSPMTVTMARKLSTEQQASSNLSRSSSGVSVRTKMSPPSAYRPSSSGKGTSLSPPAVSIPKRPSTAGGAFSTTTVASKRSPAANTTANTKIATTSPTNPIINSKGTRSLSRPSTAPQPAFKGRTEELSRSSSFFKKKVSFQSTNIKYYYSHYAQPKPEKPTSEKRSWFRFWR
ncbi:hypothetical protein FRC17_009510 [Serendipita sp. 399]|nr:hypothetical protein FRC17_009510 [Serendipita sp. 399]